MSRRLGRELAARWETRNGRKRADTVIRRLFRGDDLSSVGFGEHEGRVDLRGFAAPRPTVEYSFEKSFVGRMFRVDRLAGVTKIEGRQLVDLDFSFASLAMLKFHRTAIRNCVFDQADLKQIALWGCQIQSTSFAEADLRSAALSGDDPAPSVFNDVTFTGADMRDIAPGEADFVGCDFANARLDKVEFNGNIFERCRFAGTMKEVVFDSETVDGQRRGRLYDIDLLAAHLRLCAFRKLDLSRVRLPEGDDHIVFNHFSCTLQTALTALSETNDDALLGLRGLLEAHAAWMLPNQRIGILAVSDLHHSDSEQAAQPVARWLRQLDEECSADVPVSSTRSRMASAESDRLLGKTS